MSDLDSQIRDHLATVIDNAPMPPTTSDLINRAESTNQPRRRLITALAAAFVVVAAAMASVAIVRDGSRSERVRAGGSSSH